jgi:hypothetical protein
MPSQWALQYFDLSVEMQLQAAFAHFLGAVVVAIPLSSDVHSRKTGRARMAHTMRK